MQRLIRTGLAVSVCAFALAVPAADPPGGAITDQQHSVTYTGGPYIIPNQTARESPVTSESAPTCDDAAPICDTFELTVNLSDDLRAASGGNFAGFEITVGWALAQADFDVYLYDPTGALIMYAYTTGNPETLYPGLDQLPNGVYKLVVVPWRPLGETFTATVAATGLEAKSKLETLAGAVGLPLLAGLLLLGVLRFVGAPLWARPGAIRNGSRP